jgi:putative ABC transport system permease protein
VATAVFIMALLAGLGRAFATTGDPLNVLMLRKGSDSELAAGGVSRDAFQVLKELPGIARNSKGEPLVSGEDILVVVLPRKGGTGETNVTTRFMSPMGLEMRPQIHITQGRWFTPGQREVVVSSSINKRFEHANIGDSVHIGKGEWPIVGIFDGSGTAHDSEIWGDVNQLGHRISSARFIRRCWFGRPIQAGGAGAEKPRQRRPASGAEWRART